MKPKFRNRIERIYLFAKTDYHLRYYGSKLGILWAFLNPFLQILIYYFVFSYIIYNNKDTNLILYLFTGIISWQFFAETTTSSINLFWKQRYILQNIPLPKLDFFMALLFSKFYAYLVNLGIYFLFALLAFSPDYSWKLLMLLPMFLSLMLFTMGVAFILSTLYIFIRDIVHVWAIVLLAGFWAVPVVWDFGIIYEKYKFMMLNPVTSYLVHLRQVTLYNELPNFNELLQSLFISALFCVLGFWFMVRNSKKAMEFL